MNFIYFNFAIVIKIIIIIIIIESSNFHQHFLLFHQNQYQN